MEPWITFLGGAASLLGLLAGARSAIWAARRRRPPVQRVILFRRILRLDKRLVGLVTCADIWLAHGLIPRGDAPLPWPLNGFASYLGGIDIELEHETADVLSMRSRWDVELRDELASLMRLLRRAVAAYDRGIQATCDSYGGAPIPVSPSGKEATPCLRAGDVEEVDEIRRDVGIYYRSIARRLRLEYDIADSTGRWPVYRWEVRRVDLDDVWRGEPQPMLG